MALIVNDITVDGSNDLLIYNGDFKLSPSDNQHAEHIIRTYIGHWKEYPLLGVGIDFYRASAGLQGKLKRDINSNLTSDGFMVSEIIVTNDNKYYIDCIRIKNGNI